MGLWSFYFLGKLYLFVRGYIRFNFILNVIFAIFVLLKIPPKVPLHRFLTITKHAFSFVLAFFLLWYDSWFPPILVSINLIGQRALPSKEYIARFFLNIINTWETLVLLLLFVLCFFLKNRIKFAPIVFVLMLAVPLSGLRDTNEKGDIDSYVNTFYQSEAEKLIHFEKSHAIDAHFDIIFLHICSLSWDDLKVVGLEKHSFFKQFDIIFTNFNAATGYSEPAAVRLLQSNCGQLKHKDIYKDQPKECYLLENLRELGYETYSIVNNYDPGNPFVNNIIKYGLADPPIATKGIPIKFHSFNNTPIFNDLALLKTWLHMRQESKAQSAALFFNTPTLHSGAHIPNEKDWWKRNEESRYKKTLQSFFKDIEKFFNQLEHSEKNFIVIFIPEHGLALRGSSIQPQDIRDIPLPQITLVPVGIKLIGKNHLSSPSKQTIISKPTSYFAIAHILSSFLKESPFKPSHQIQRQNIFPNIPETPFISENEVIQVVKRGSNYFAYTKEKKWVKLPDSE